MPTERIRECRKFNAKLYARLIKLLLEHPFSIQELADELGLHYLTVSEYVRALYHEKVVHIASYQTDSIGRRSIRIYAFGNKRDAKKLPIPDHKRQAELRARKKFLQTQLALEGKGEFIKQKNGRFRFVQKLPLDTQLELS